MTNEQRDKFVSKMLTDGIIIASVADAEALVRTYGEDCPVAVSILKAMRRLEAGEDPVTIHIHSDDDVNANALDSDDRMSYKTKLDKHQKMRPRLNLEPVTVCAAVDLYYGNVRYLTNDDFDMDEEGLLHIKSEVHKSLTMAFDPIVYISPGRVFEEE